MPSYNIATRTHALTLKLASFLNAEIKSITKIKPRLVNTLLPKALARRFKPNKDP